MKGAIAAWGMACNNILKKKKLNIALALLITGDEEGIATNGTIKVVQYLKQKTEIPLYLLTIYKMNKLRSLRAY